MVKRILTVLLLGGTTAFSDMAQEEFILANELMKDEQYREAAEKYETLLHQGYRHPDLYYNLGNSYFRQGKYGHAVWAFESGLILSPLDKDLQFNLNLTETRLRDRIKEPKTFILLTLYRSLKYRMHVLDGLFTGSLLTLITAILYVLYRFRRFTLRFTSKIVPVLILFTFLVHIITLDKYWDLSRTLEGIIIEPECSAYSLPMVRPESTLFKLHEGTKGRITQEQEEWLEIELIDGNKGWVEKKYIRKL